MVMFTRSSRDNFLLATRISIPTMCLFSSRSTVTPSSMSILSSTDASLNWIYKASASLSYSILNANHLKRIISDAFFSCKRGLKAAICFQLVLRSRFVFCTTNSPFPSTGEGGGEGGARITETVTLFYSEGERKEA